MYVRLYDSIEVLVTQMDWREVPKDGAGLLRQFFMY